jgi:branched-chain amino acid transport system substrate-binding protein
MPMTTSRRTRPHRAPMALAAGLLLALSACSGSAADKSGGKAPAEDAVARIGLLTPSSGPYAAVGEDTRAGLELYRDTHDGKLGGLKAEVIVRDEGAGPPTAVPAATELVKQHRVLAVTGVVSGGSVAGILPLLADNDTALMGVAGRPEFPDPKLTAHVWSFNTQSYEAGAAAGPWIKEHVAGPVYAIGPDYQGGWDQLKGFTESFTKAGGTLANPDGKTTFTPFPATQNFLPYLNKIAQSGAKAIYSFYAGTAAVDFVKQYKQSDAATLPLYGSGPLTEGRQLDAQGDAAADITTFATYGADLDNPANRAFVAAWQQRHPDRSPTIYAVAAWDIARSLDTAIAAVRTGGKPLTPEAVNAALGSVGQIDSPRGAMQLNPVTHSPVQQWYRFQVRADGPKRANVAVEQLAVLGG